MTNPQSRASVGSPTLAPMRFVAAVLATLLAITLGCLAVIATHRVFDPDELEAIHVGWNLSQGRMIYRDFFEHHHPLFYLLLAPLLAVLPQQAVTLVLLRGLNLVLAVGVLALSFAVARRLFGVLAGLCAALLLATATIFIAKAIEVRPDNLQALCGLAGIALLIRHFDRPRWQTVLASGIMLGLAFLTLQKAVFLVTAVAAVVGLRVVQRRAPWQDLVLLATGLGLAVLPSLVWLAATGTLRTFWAVCYTLNLRQTYVADVISVMRTTPAVYTALGRSLGQSPLLWGCFAAALVATIRTGVPSPDTRLRRELLFLCSISIGWVIVFNKYYLQYYLPALPLIAVLAAGTVVQIVRTHSVPALSFMAATVVGTMFVAVDEARRSAIDHDLARVASVLAATRPGDVVVDGSNAFNVFRESADYMWFVSTDRGVVRALHAATGYDYDILATIAARRPAVVARAALLPGTWPDDPRVSRYVPFPGHEDLLIDRDRLQ